MRIDQQNMCFYYTSASSQPLNLKHVLNRSRDRDLLQPSDRMSLRRSVLSELVHEGRRLKQPAGGSSSCGGDVV